MTIPLTLLALHTLGDFFLQSDAMALNKSKSWIALTWHVWVYSACFVWYGWAFVSITFLLHFLTDAITSRVTSRLWFIPMERVADNDGDGLFYAYPEFWKRHWFFTAIGVDQLLHFTALAWTLRLLS